MGSMAGLITRWRNMWTSERLNWAMVRLRLSAAGTSMGRHRLLIPGCSASAADWSSAFRNASSGRWRRPDTQGLLGFGVGDVNDCDPCGAAFGGDLNHDVVFVLCASGGHDSAVGLSDRRPIAE